MKYLIIIGSAYRYESEINIPVSVDSLSEWKVYSIDHSPIMEDIKKEYSVDSTTVHRMQINVSDVNSNEYKTFIEELGEFKQSDVYVVDSISCGFISNFAVSLLKLLINELNCSVFFSHYISSFNQEPSFSLVYMKSAINDDDSVIDEILNILEFKKPFKKNQLKGLINSQNERNYLANALEEFIHANKFISFKENKSSSDLRSIISKFETRLISFVSLNKETDISVENLNQYRKSVCYAKNTFSVGGLEILLSKHGRTLLIMIIIIIVLLLLLIIICRTFGYKTYINLF